jgi:signal transduction histidine kinase
MWFNPKRARADWALLLAGGLAVATGLTFWLGLRATREWRRSTIQAAETRGNEAVTLLAVALERDMKGGQISVLLKLNDQELRPIAPYELADRFARGFARFPYLDSFFVWTANGGDGTTYVFNRADRRPAWDAAGAMDDPFPVVFRRDPPALRDVVRLVRAQATDSRRFVLFEASVDGVRYQAVTHFMYDGVGQAARLVSAVGFMVNLEWVQAHYFRDFLAQMQSVIGDPSLSIEIADADGHAVAAIGPPMIDPPRHVRSFAPVFADQALSDLPQRQRDATWTTRVGVASAATLSAAGRGASQTLTLLGLGALVTIIGLAIAVRAARRSAELADVQSEFVSAVSHEMKTPLSLIKLASDTLANGRYTSPAAITEYGRMIAVEAQHLARLIDNVLCYARINDTTSDYDFESVDVAEVVQESVDRFRPQLQELGFDVQVSVPPEPQLVRADHLMLAQAFDNLIDNALKYGGSGRWLGVTVSPNARLVHVEVADRGEGIPADDLPRVFDRFYRRKGTRHRGAGLGLAIVRRIVEDHQGTVTFSSTPGHGSRVDVALPVTDG